MPEPKDFDNRWPQAAPQQHQVLWWERDIKKAQAKAWWHVFNIGYVILAGAAALVTIWGFWTHGGPK